MAEGINNAGSMLASAGNSYEETIAMLAAANTTVQDISKSSTGLRTVAARIRNTKTELDDLGEAMTDADYDALVRGLTKANVALTDAQGNFRSTYDIIRDLSKVWNQLSNIDQAALAKTLAGTRQQNVFFSLIEQFQEAEGAMQSMEASTGALSDAMAVFESTTTAHLNNLKTAFLDLAHSLFESSFLQFFIDLGTHVLEGITAITQFIDKIGGMRTVIMAVVAILMIYKAEMITTTLVTVKNAVVTGATAAWGAFKKAILGIISIIPKYRAMMITAKTETVSFSAAAQASIPVLGLLLAALTVVSAAMSASASNAEDTAAKIKQAEQESIRNAKTNLSNANSLFDLRQGYVDIANSTGDYTTKMKSLREWQDKVIQNYGFEKDAIDQVNLSRKESIALIDKEIVKGIDRQLAENADAYDQANKKLDTRTTLLDSASVVTDYLVDINWNWHENDINWELGRIVDQPVKQAYDDLVDFVNRLRNSGRELTVEEQAALTVAQKYLSNIKDEYGDAFEVVENYEKLLSQKMFLETEIEFGDISNQEDYDNFIKKLKEKAAAQVEQDTGVSIVIDYGDGTSEPYIGALGESLIEMAENTFPQFAKESSAAAASANYLTTSLSDVENQADVATEAFNTTTKGISSLQSVLSKQSTGASLSIDDFNSEELKDYTSALEYHNGVLQLNAEKTRELVEAKTQDELATISENKALAQSKYLQNAKEIQRLTDKIKTNTYETGENKEAIEEQISKLQDENSSLLTTCSQYDLMSASLREATDAYHNWLNAQKASQAGDMFDDTLDAINRINDTLNNKDSDYFGRVGRTDYQAALDFVIPDTVDREDTDAINSYLESVSDLFTYDDKGNRAGLNITNFCKQAVEQGLMVFDEASDSYLVAGQTTMEDFAEGMNLSLPLVQAMFGEMEEFGGKFSWADEAVKTLGDLAISADVAANRLRESHGEFGFDIKLDYSDLDTTEEKIGAIEQTISNMRFMKLDVGSYDPGAVDDCNSVLQYLIMQKQQLSAPAVMTIDTSKVSESTGAALQLLQEFTGAVNNLELKQELGLDTTDAQAEVDRLYGEIAGSDNDALIALSVDTTSIETVKSSLSELSQEEIMTILKLDDTALKDYQAEDKQATVYYDVDSSRVDAYDPKNLQRTVTYNVRTVGMDKLNGTAHASGTALASGDWGTAPGGKTLVGELGKELLVDVHTGRWYTVGDNGAEFINVPRGAIVFNHKQTESLLKNGYVSGRAAALVGGTAMVTGGIGAGNAENSSHSGGNKPHSGGGSGSSSKPSSSSSTSSNSSSKSDKEPQIFDWIEVAIARIEREIKKLKTIAESTYKSLKTKLGASYDEIAKVNKEIAIQQQGYSRYMKQAESVGLSADLKAKVQNGSIQISEYDEDTQKLIKSYQEWIEKAYSCADAIDELHESLAKLYEDNFNATQKDFENKLSLIEHLTKMYQSSINLFEAKGYLESTKFTKAMQAANSQRLSTLNQELIELQQKFSEAMASGEIEKYSDSWFLMQQEINACKEAIADANVEAAELAKTVREIEWGYFDYEQDRISQLTQEADFLIDLMSNQDLHDDRGQLTDYGMATMGLHGQNYNVYMAQADDYAKEILALDKQIADDPYNTDLIKRREELIKLQQESIKNAEAEKQAMIELVKQGIQIELSALKDLIDAYKESLDNAKALYEYQSKVTDKAAEIARLQKQLSAYSGDTSAETQATVQKLQVDLSKAQEDLAKTEYEQFISDQKKLLDELYDEYEEVLNQRLDDVDALISDLIDGVNSNSDKINETIGGVAADVGYNLTPQMQEIWNNSTGSTEGVISKYGDDFSEKLTAVNSVLAGIHANVADMIEHSDKEAAGDVGSQTPTTTPTPPSDGGGNPPPAPKPSDGGGGGGATLDEQTKKKVAAAIWRGGLGWGVNPDRAKRLKEVFGANNGIQALVNKGVGKNDGGSDVKNYTYLAMRKKFKGYKTGGLVDYTGLAQVDGTPQKPELMLNAKDAQNFLALRDTLRNLSMQPLTLGNSFGFGVDHFVPPMLEAVNADKYLSKMGAPTIQQNNTVSFGDIKIDHVLDYNDFVQQLRNDSQFEEMIQGMTLGRAMGKTSLTKYKYQWK